MNKYKYILIPAILFVLLVGCEKDLLKTIPNDRISTEVYWKTDQDAVFAANAIYEYLIPDARHWTEWDGMSDIAHINVGWRAAAYVDKNVHDAAHSKMLYEWSHEYEGIQACNRFLANVDDVETNDQSLIDRLKGEVKVLRAYFYVKLVMLFGDVPLVDGPITVEESQSVSRTPVSQVWDFIDTELTAAAADLPTSQADVGRITKGAALALKARAMLYAGRYTESAAAAKAVMDLNVYSLYASYENLFTYAAENNSEVVLDKQYLEDNVANNMYTLVTPGSLTNVTNQAGIVPTKKMVDAYQMTNGMDINDAGSGFDPFDPYTNRDPRLRHTTYVTGDILPDGSVFDPRPGSGTADEIGFTQDATATGFNIRKYHNYENRDQPDNCGINIILIRYAEVLLIYAEAKIEANQIDQSVLDAINEVRSRPDVNMPDITTMVQSELRDIVRLERKVELAFEGLRYFDIRRWKIAEYVIPGNVYGMTYDDGTGTLVTISYTGYERTFNPSRDYLWPIPKRETELNPNLTQNPNW